MKKIFYSVIVSCALFGFMYAIIPNSTMIKKQQDAGSTIGSKRAWELSRLKDPATGKVPHNIKVYEREFAKKLPGALTPFFKNSDALLSDDGWMQRGPYNIGGRTRALAIDINDQTENTIIAAGVSGGMWRTTDGGQNWAKTTKPDQLHSVSCLIQDSRPGKTNNWYYGTGELWGNSADISGDGIFKSTDGAKSWNIIQGSSTNHPESWDSPLDYVWKLVLNHKNTVQDELIAAVGLGGIYRSTDGGENWKNVLGGSGNSYSLFTDVNISQNGVLYATLSQKSVGTANSSVKGIYRSTNGIDWTNITPANFPANYNRIVSAISPSNENIVYFITETPDYGKLTRNMSGDSMYHSLYKYTYISGNGSGDGGFWEDRTENIPSKGDVRHQFNSQGCYNLVAAVKPDDSNVLMLGAVNLDRSVDGFLTSTNTKLIGGTCPDNTCIYFYRYPNHHSDVHALNFSSLDPNILFSGSDGGIHKTLNCLSDNVEWISLNNGYYTTQFYSIAMNKAIAGDYRLLGGLQDNGTLLSLENNTNYHWTHTIFNDGFCCAMPNSGNFYYASDNSTPQPKIHIWRFLTDGQGNTIRKTRIDPVGGKDFIWNTPFKLDPNNDNIMYLCGGKTIWRNKDMSLIPDIESLDSTSLGWDEFTNTAISNGNYTAIAISKSPANILYFGTSSGKLYKMNNANTGIPELLDITATNFPNNGNIECIEIDPYDANRVFCVFSNYNILSVFMSTDGGNTWSGISGNLEESMYGGGTGPAVLWAKLLKLKNGNYRYFLGTSTGLYSTSYIDGMYTVWEQEAATSIGNVVINMIDAREADGFVAVATHGTGTYTKLITENNQMISQFAQPILPLNNSKSHLNEITLTWSKIKGSNYIIQISKNSEFTDIIKEEKVFSDTSLTLDIFEQGKITYYWRVITICAAGVTPASQSYSFTTAINPPVLTFPANNSTNISISPTLTWEPVSSASQYHVLISKNSLFTTKYLDTIVNTNWVKASLDLNKNYCWKVSSISSDGEGIYSNFFKFSTQTSISVDDLFNIAGSIFMGQNYPNPFNFSTHIEISLPKSSSVLLEIFDMSGKLVNTPINSNYPEGKHTIVLYKEGLTSGVYIYKLSTKYETISKAMIIK